MKYATESVSDIHFHNDGEFTDTQRAWRFLTATLGSRQKKHVENENYKKPVYTSDMANIMLHRRTFRY
jgi:hypothetical protein